MAQETGISWCHHSWSPWVGCAKISPGCNACYMFDWAGRAGRSVVGKEAPRPMTKTWGDVKKWNRKAEGDGVRRRVFPSLCDPFECRDGPMMAIQDEMWDLIQECPGLDFLLLTKRPGNIAGSLPDDWGEGWPNVWLGTSVESGEDSCVCGVSRRPVRERVLELARVPAVVRFVSYEPAIASPLGMMDMLDGEYLESTDIAFEEPIDWLIFGGESGGRRRPEGILGDPKIWARQLRDWCRARGVDYWHKQSSNLRPDQGVELDGEIIHQLPTPRRSVLPVGTGQASLFKAGS